MTQTYRAWIVLVVVAAAGLIGCGKSEPPEPPARIKLSRLPAATEAIDEARLAKAQDLINDGLRFLLAQREADGGWSFGGGVMKPAITALVLKSLLPHPDFNADTPEVKKAFDVVLSYRQADGSIMDPKMGSPAYTTAIAIMAMAEAKDPRFTEAIRSASEYLKGIQIQPGQESPDGGTVDANSPRVGGVGYGRNGEPNISVLGFAMEAWRDAGVGPEDPAMKRAVGFLARLQNSSETNPLPWAAEGSNDGGYIYDLITSKAEDSTGSGRRSYGSVTYVGFKSLLYAGVAKDDPRVQGAYMWIRRYWRLDSNPNMPKAQSLQGLFYYYHVFAKALRAWGADVIPDLKGVEHNWRHELIDALAQRAGSDGSWVNDEKRWEETNPVLVTCYSLMALEEALKK